MTDHIWLSNASTLTELMYWITSNVATEDVSVAIEAVMANSNGKSVNIESCHTRLWGSDEVEFDEVVLRPPSDLFYAGSYWIVSARAAAIIRRFDLGEGGLYPVTQGLYRRDRTTRVDGEYFTWIWGNRKTAFLEADSPNVPTFGGGVRDRCSNVSRLKDDDAAVSRAALTGPDVWVDPLLFKSLFLSGPLGDALAEAGMREAFALLRCRVV